MGDRSLKRYEFSFKTKLKFQNKISNQHFMLKCLPGEYQFQRIYDEKISVLPDVNCSFNKDSFGNRTISGSIKDKHELFEYKVAGKALLSRYKSTEILDRIFLYETHSTTMSKEMEDFTLSIPEEDSVQKQAISVSHAVYNKMEYVLESTDTETTASKAFHQGKGVCQDYAHITIALLRNLKIPARYCAGLMMGEGKTHAWVEYYDGSSWYGIDPTNDQIIEYGYIKISSGRDCSDCTVDRGCFVSENKEVQQEIQISAKVGEING